MIETIAQAYVLQRLDGTLTTLRSRHLRVVHQRQLHVLDGCGLSQQVIVLKHETNLTVAQTSTLCLRHLTHRDTIQIILTTGGSIETAQLVEQGRLTRARGTLYGNELALVDLERHATEGLHRLAAHLEIALDVIQFNNYFLIFIHIVVSFYSPPSQGGVGGESVTS